MIKHHVYTTEAKRFEAFRWQILMLYDATLILLLSEDSFYCEAQARVRQGSARDGSQGERPQSLNPSLELTLKLVATFHHP